VLVTNLPFLKGKQESSSIVKLCCHLFLVSIRYLQLYPAPFFEPNVDKNKPSVSTPSECRLKGAYVARIWDSFFKRHYYHCRPLQLIPSFPPSRVVDFRGPFRAPRKNLSPSRPHQNNIKYCPVSQNAPAAARPVKGGGMASERVRNPTVRRPYD